MKKSDAYFVKYHLCKSVFTPKNVYFKIGLYYPSWYEYKFGCYHVFCCSYPLFLQIVVLRRVTRLQDTVM